MDSTDEVRTAAWLSEMWPTCREWHQTRDEKNAATVRNEALDDVAAGPRLEGAR